MTFTISIDNLVVIRIRLNRQVVQAAHGVILVKIETSQSSEKILKVVLFVFFFKPRVVQSERAGEQVRLVRGKIPNVFFFY